MFKRKKPSGSTGFIKLYLRQLRRYMTTGLMVWVPLIITAWVCWAVVSKLGLGLENIIRNVVSGLNGLGGRVPFLSFLQSIEYYRGMGFLVAVALFLTTGFLARYLVWRRVIASGEYILDRIPMINRVYRAVQQIRDTITRRDGTVFQHVCLIEYPRPGVFVVAFVTSTEQGVVQEAARRELTAVFVPTTPNPTSGFLLYLPPDQIKLLDIGVEDAMKLIVSGGAFLPGPHVSVEQLDQPPRSGAPVEDSES